MKNQISYANVTSGDGLVIRFERSIPQHKLEKHQEFVRTVKTAKPSGERWPWEMMRSMRSCGVESRISICSASPGAVGNG